MTLRERLVALAHDPACPWESDLDMLALAAARMALEEAHSECCAPAAFDQDDCKNNVRALRDGLE